jgi:5-methylcytosine-specific restriction endonuclease McrA
MTASHFKISSKDKKNLRTLLYERDGTKCHYCGIEQEDFPRIWGDTFYGGIRRGRVLEIDRKNNNQDYSLGNSVLACALCNMAKSDKLEYEEFKKVGDVIRQIWQQKKAGMAGLAHTALLTQRPEYKKELMKRAGGPRDIKKV